jgi:DNA-binding response OmpR family regulator
MHAASYEPSDLFRRGSLWLNIDQGLATVDGEAVRLSVTEARVLRHLMVNDGKTISWADLAQSIWGDTATGSDDTLKVAVRRLQRKINHDMLHVASGGVRLRSE